MAYDDETLEAAAQLLDRMAGNSIYQFAWRAGAKRIRGLKSDAKRKVLNDTREQLVSESSGECR